MSTDLLSSARHRAGAAVVLVAVLVVLVSVLRSAGDAAPAQPISSGDAVPAGLRLDPEARVDVVAERFVLIAALTNTGSARVVLTELAQLPAGLEAALPSDGLALAPELDTLLWDYLERAAHSLQNRSDGAPPARTLALAWRPRSPRAAAFRALAPTIAAGMTA